MLLISAEKEVPSDTKLCIVRANEREKTTAKTAAGRYRYDSIAYKKMGKNMEPYLITPAFDEEAVFSPRGRSSCTCWRGPTSLFTEQDVYPPQRGQHLFRFVRPAQR